MASVQMMQETVKASQRERLLRVSLLQSIFTLWCSY